MNAGYPVPHVPQLVFNTRVLSSCRHFHFGMSNCDVRLTCAMCSRSTSIRTMSVLHSRAGSPHTSTLNSHFNSAASSGSVTLDRMHRGDFMAYSPNLSGLANRNLTYTGFDGQSYRLPQPAGEEWSLSRNGPRPSTSNHRGIYYSTYHQMTAKQQSLVLRYDTCSSLSNPQKLVFY